MKDMTDINMYSNDLFSNRDEKGYLMISSINFIPESREKMGNEYIILLKLNSEDNDPNGIIYKKYYLIILYTYLRISLNSGAKI